MPPSQPDDRPRRWQRGPEGTVVRLAEPSPPPDASPEDGPATPAKAKWGLALRLGFRDTYDYLGTVLLMSLLWTAVAALGALGGHQVGLRLSVRLPGFLPLFISVVAALGGLAIASGPLMGGLHRFAKNATARDEPEVFDLAWGYRSAFWRCAGLAAIQVLVGLVLFANGLFYLWQRGIVPMVLGVLFAYTWVFWLAACSFMWPLLVEQDLRPVVAVRKAALLVLDNLSFTVALSLISLALTAVLWVTVLPGILLWAGTLAMFQTQAVRELLRKYGLMPPDPTLDPIADETTG